MQIDLSQSAPVAPPRKSTAIGVMGNVGQLFTVYEKNWKCPDCGQENYASRPRCYRCRGHKPEGENYDQENVLKAMQTGEEIPWKEAVDPNTFQIYYYNTKTLETTWDRPPELGPAPHATGWFGRGKSGTLATQYYVERNATILQRPARKQKDFIDPKKYHLEGANEFNIWYGRYIGDHWDSGAGKEKATDRCKFDTDAGATRADSGTNSKITRRSFCIHFAHGACAKGKDCEFYHRTPTLEDDSKCDELVDCFGRARHNKHRDDMTGVGSFLRPCRTLFVGGIQKHKYDTPQMLEECLWKHFGEWGEVEHINVIYRLSIAFVRYRVRTSAEFAKEAMHCQTLDQGETLDIRWAHDDPNPVAKDAIERADRDAMYALLQAKGVSLENTSFLYPADYRLPEAKRLKLENGEDVLRSNPEIAYPNTDTQYITTNETREEVCNDQRKNDQFASNADASSDWKEYVDEDTGATYLYNEKTGESVWGNTIPST